MGRLNIVIIDTIVTAMQPLLDFTAGLVKSSSRSGRTGGAKPPFFGPIDLNDDPILNGNLDVAESQAAQGGLNVCQFLVRKGRVLERAIGFGIDSVHGDCLHHGVHGPLAGVCDIGLG